jgi:HAD superfamily hydrolase (TIGR01490 family)
MKQSNIAFIDLDKTLISENSASAWLKKHIREGKISVWRTLEACYWILRYRLGLGDLEKDFRSALFTLKGTKESVLLAEFEQLYESHLRKTLRPGALAAVNLHQSKGDALVLLSSSPHHFGRFFVRDLKLDAALCTELEVDNEGYFTGKAIDPICFGKGKLAKAMHFATSNGVALKDCTFYTDSIVDRPVLEAVGYPHCINPDPKLRYLARARGWPVQDWG